MGPSRLRLLRIVPESTVGEELPDTETPQLVLGTGAQISRQETQMDFIRPGKLRQKLRHAGQQRAGKLSRAQAPLKMPQIAVMIVGHAVH